MSQDWIPGEDDFADSLHTRTLFSKLGIRPVEACTNQEVSSYRYAFL